MRSLLEESPEGFARRLAERGRRRACFVRDPAGGLRASDPWLAGVAAGLAALPDFRHHEGIFLEVGRESGGLLAAAVHATVRGQALGGVRHAAYPSALEMLRDGLRLAVGMTRKSALAGLWWGGGKGLIARAPGGPAADPGFRRALYRDYGAFVSGLRGLYVTAEDAGTSPGDMAAVFETTRFATCVPPDVGGSGNPSGHTAAGVVCAMAAALDHLGLGGLAGRRFAVQGGGQVGAGVVERLVEAGAAGVRVAELAAERREELADRFAGAPVEVVPGELPESDAPGVLAADCDVLAPCALGGVLGPKTIPHVRARVVCGAANNQLVDDARDGAALHARGVVFVPEIIANRMGVVRCANEQYGAPRPDPAVERHLGDDWEEAIGPTVHRVLARSAREDVPPVVAANRLADEAAQVPHPLWPERGRQLLETLLAERWHEGDGR